MPAVCRGTQFIERFRGTPPPFIPSYGPSGVQCFCAATRTWRDRVDAPVDIRDVMVEEALMPGTRDEARCDAVRGEATESLYDVERDVRAAVGEGVPSHLVWLHVDALRGEPVDSVFRTEYLRLLRAERRSCTKR